MRYAGFLAVILLAAGCGIADFDVEQAIPEQRISGSPLGALLGQLFAVPVRVELQQQIQAHDTGPIRRIALASLALDVTTTGVSGGVPADADDWGFVESVTLWVASTKAGTGLARVQIAKGQSPGPSQHFPFQVVGDVNLAPYVDEGCELSSEAVGRAPPDDVTFAGSAVFTVSPL